MGDSDVGYIVMLVTSWWWLISEVAGRIIIWRLYWWFSQCIKSVTNISNLSPTHFVNNIRHQHRCNHKRLLKRTTYPAQTTKCPENDLKWPHNKLWTTSSPKVYHFKVYLAISDGPLMDHRSLFQIISKIHKLKVLLTKRCKWTKRIRHSLWQTLESHFSNHSNILFRF